MVRWPVELVHYHGVVAPASKWRAAIVPELPVADGTAAGWGCEAVGESKNRRRPNHSWAFLMARVFEIDVLKCRHCHGRLRIVAAIHPPVVTRKILDCLGLPAVLHRSVRRFLKPLPKVSKCPKWIRVPRQPQVSCEFPGVSAKTSSNSPHLSVRWPNWPDLRLKRISHIMKLRDIVRVYSTRRAFVHPMRQNWTTPWQGIILAISGSPPSQFVAITDRRNCLIGFTAYANQKESAQGYRGLPSSGKSGRRSSPSYEIQKLDS